MVSVYATDSFPMVFMFVLSLNFFKAVRLFTSQISKRQSEKKEIKFKI
jgi:hypothetical protein